MDERLGIGRVLERLAGAILSADPRPAAWLETVPIEAVSLLGVALAAWAVAAVVVGWKRGSWWAVPATAGFAFGGTLSLFSLMLLDQAREGADIAGGAIAYAGMLMMLEACAAGVVLVSLVVVLYRLRRRPRAPRSSVFLPGGAAAGLVFLGWAVVLFVWADEQTSDYPTLVPAPIGRLIALAGAGAVAGLVGWVVGWFLGQPVVRMLAVTDRSARPALAGLLAYLAVGVALWQVPALRAWDDPTRLGSCSDAPRGCTTLLPRPTRSSQPTSSPRPTARPRPTPTPVPVPYAAAVGESVVLGPLTVTLLGVEYAEAIAGRPPSNGAIDLVLNLGLRVEEGREVAHDRAWIGAVDGSGHYVPTAPQLADALPAEPALRGETTGTLVYLVPRETKRVTITYLVEGGRLGAIAWSIDGPPRPGTPSAAPTSAPLSLPPPNSG